MSTIYFYLASKAQVNRYCIHTLLWPSAQYPVGNVFLMKIQPRRILLLLQSCWRKPLRTIHVRYITLCLPVT